MRSDELTKVLDEIGQRWMYNIIYPNVTHTGERRRNDVPWNGLVVIGDLGSEEGHECIVYDPIEGCFEDGHDNYQFVAWIDIMGKIHYLEHPV